MTGYTVHTGTSDEYTSGWDRIFQDAKKGPKNSSSSKSGKASGKTAKKNTAASKSSKKAQSGNPKATKKASSSRSKKKSGK